MNAELSIAPKMRGLNGYGESIFEDEEAGKAKEFLAALADELAQISLSDQEMSPELVDFVLSVAKHLDNGSFPVNGSGQARLWAEAREIAEKIKQYKQLAHFWGAAAHYGFSTAQEATMEALSSGHVLTEIELGVEQEGSAELKSWFKKLGSNTRQELENIIVSAAAKFWISFVKEGPNFLSNWKRKRQHTLDEQTAAAPPPPVNYTQQSNGYTNGSVNGSSGQNGAYLRPPTQQPRPAAPPPADAEHVCPDEVIEALRTVIVKKFPAYEGKPGNKPVRVERIIATLEEANDSRISLDALEKKFKDDGVKQDVRKTAASAVSWLNSSLIELNLPFEIKTIRTTFYQFVPRCRH